MVDIKNDFTGGLDLDTSKFLLKKNTYIDALNITRDAIESGYDLVPTNIISNRLVDYALPPGRNKTIGFFPFMLRNSAYYIVWNQYNVHSVLEYNNTTRTIAKVFQNLTDTGGENVLSLTENIKVNSINIFPRTEGDLLFFLDSDKRPTTMDVTAFKNGTYTPVTRDILDVAKCPPLSPPDCVYDNDTGTRTNDLRNKLFKFKYRWVYDANEKSTPSPISALPLPDNILDEEFTNVVTNNNVIRVQMESGDKSVKAIELLMSYVNKTNIWSDFVLVDSINKTDESIGDDTSFIYDFYNNSAYPTIDVNESIQLFDYVPDEANAQEMPNGNVLVYSGITEGYDRDLDPNVVVTVDTVAAGDGGSTGSLSVSVEDTDLHAPNIIEYFLRFIGIPATGTVVTTKLRRLSDNAIITVGSYTTVAGDSEYDVRVGLQGNMNFLNIVFDVDLNTNGTLDFEFYFTEYAYSETTIEPPAADVDDNSTATWPWSTGRSLGLVYFDKKGKTNGVLYNTGVVFPAYAENGSQQVLLPYINAKIYHVPPDWAYSFQWVVTKEPTQFLFWLTKDVNTSESDYLYFDITNIVLNASKNPTTEAVLSWSFQDGDRLRLIRRMSDDTIYADTYDAAVEGIVVDPTLALPSKEDTALIKKSTKFLSCT